MTFDVEIDGAATRLEVDRDGEQCRFRFGPQPERRAQLTEVEPGVYSVLLDGRSYEARAEPGEDCAWITIRGHRFRVAITDPRRWLPKGGGGHGAERENVVAAMPGKIVRVLVKPGDSVAAGQGILVVEAMKMQNEMKTRRGGHVVAVAVREGETVAAGAVLATIE
ncbi:MAG TPA: biotin/lipoyl-containing protein [Candidatus Binatia bacterium]|nr:biotin/lipoyl-containing protein [Candidatus Binatia bacterium]